MLRDLGIDDRADERRIAVGVQQVERAVAVQRLLLVDEVERQVQRALRSFRHHHVGRRPAEVHADVLVDLAVDGRDGWNFDVGVVECRELLFPVGVLELQEDRSQRADVIERRVRIRLDVRGRHFRPRCARHDAPAAAKAARTAGPPRRPKPRAPGSDAIASRAALRSVLSSRLSPFLSNSATTLRSPAETTETTRAARPSGSKWRRSLEARAAGALRPRRRFDNAAEQDVAGQAGDNAQESRLSDGDPRKLSRVLVHAVMSTFAMRS